MNLSDSTVSQAEPLPHLFPHKVAPPAEVVQGHQYGQERRRLRTARLYWNHSLTIRPTIHYNGPSGEGTLLCFHWVSTAWSVVE